MDAKEALLIANRHLDPLRKFLYGELRRLIRDHPLETVEEAAPSGTRYCLEIEIR